MKLRIATYNVHGCQGIDGVRSCERVAETLEALGADIVALQEVDVERKRSRLVHQAEHLAKLLGMHFVFAAAIDDHLGKYGNAVISRMPILDSRTVSLPATGGLLRRFREPRCAVRASFEGVDVVSTHLGLVASDRDVQIRALSAAGFLDPTEGRPLVVCGDLNAGPGSGAHAVLAGKLADAQHASRHGARRTWPSWFPLRPLDHIFVGGRARILDAEVVLAHRAASDHLPVVATLELERATP